MLLFAAFCVLVMFMNFDLSCRFALTTAGLCRAVAASLRMGMSAAMIVLVWTRVKRAEVAFLALAERVRAGRYRAGVSRGGVTVRGPAAGVDGDESVGSPCVARVSRGRLPVRFGWLMAAMPYEAAGYGSQLRSLLAEPEMAALVRDVAQARRILGPMCQMLGVELPDEPGCDVVRAEAVVRPRVKRVRKVVDWGRIPLPRGVLAAARRQGYGKIP